MAAAMITATTDAPPDDASPLSVAIAGLRDVAFTIGFHLRSITLRVRPRDAPLSPNPQPSPPAATSDRNRQKLVSLLRVFCDSLAIHGFNVVTVDLQPFQPTAPTRQPDKRWRAEVTIIDEGE